MPMQWILISEGCRILNERDELHFVDFGRSFEALRFETKAAARSLNLSNGLPTI